LFNARDATLYKQLNKEMGRQLPILLLSPFFGIIFIFAVRNESVSLDTCKHFNKYLCNGVRKYFQYLLMKQLLSPSMPAALRLP
jgi:hypothetical protein